jgi:hypothetical protein
MDAAPGTLRATRREWIGLGVIALACVLYVMDLTVLHLAIPQISEDLRPTSARHGRRSHSGLAAKRRDRAVKPSSPTRNTGLWRARSTDPTPRCSRPHWKSFIG